MKPTTDAKWKEIEERLKEHPCPPERVSLSDCLREIDNALNYWYPTKATADEEERNARHVRLFEFRNRLERELKK